MLTDEDKSWLDGMEVGESLTTNLSQPTTPDQRATAIEAGRREGVSTEVAERNPELLKKEDKAWLDAVDIPPMTRDDLENPDLGPALADDVDNYGFWEKFAGGTMQRIVKGTSVVTMGELGTKLMEGTITEAERVELAEAQARMESDFMREDYGFENPLLATGAFIHGAVMENIPIMAYMAWESKEEAAQGAIAGTLMGAAASAPTAGTLSPITATTGAVVGLGVGFKLGSAKAAYALEAGNAYLEYIAMRDPATGEAMDPNVAKGAAMSVGLANAALETVAFGRMLQNVPGMEKVMGGFSRGGMRKLMKNSSARSALGRWGANVAKTSAVEGMTEMGQETLTILGGIIAGEVAEGEFDVPTIMEAMHQVGSAGLQGAAGGGGIAMPTAGASSYLEFRKERAATKNMQTLVELEKMAKDSLVAGRLPGDFKQHLLDVRNEHGDLTQTLVPLNTLQTFFQNAQLSDEQVAERMPGVWAAMEEAELSGVEVNIPYEELGTELARLEGFDQIAPDIRITAEGLTGREAQKLATEREAVYAEYTDLANREEAHEGSANRVQEDVRTMLEEAGVAPSVAEHQAELHGEFWKRAGERFGRDPFEVYKAYAGLSVGRLKSEILEGQGFERSDAILARLREGNFPTQQQMFGASLAEFLRANGGLKDEGGELAARDLSSIMRQGPTAMSFETAHQRLIEAGFLSEESWGDKSQGDLLTLIDQDIHQGGVYRLGGGDPRMQDTAREMQELEEILDALGVDITTLTNEEVRAAIDEGSYWQRQKETKGLGKHLEEGNYNTLDAPSKVAVDAAIAESEEPARIKDALLRFKDTAWAYQAIAGAKARIAVRHIIAGEEVPFASVFDNPRTAATRKALEAGGMQAVEQILIARSMIGQAGKPVNAVNGSFLDCEPSPNCAKYCYATGGNYKYAANIIKGELVSLFVNENPVRAAELIASQYSPMVPDPKGKKAAAHKALRLFDKGDGNMNWIPVIKALNERGVSVQIFSKRPEFLRAVPDQNWRMLSVDTTNYDLAAENADLDIAFVYEGTDDEITWMNANKERIAVILPIMGKGTVAEKAAMVNKIPVELKKKKCPIDSGVTNVKNGNQVWNCQRCDAGGGVGCYNDKTTVSKAALNESFPVLVQRAEDAGIVKELEDFRDGLTGNERQLLDSELAGLLSEARAGFDASTAREPQIEVSGAAERAELGAGGLRAAGSAAIKKLYQWHGAAVDFDAFDPAYMGTGEGWQAFGWGLYFTDLPTTAEHYRQVALESMALRQEGIILKPLNDMLEQLSLEVTGVQVAGFLVGEKIAGAVRRAGVGTKATVIAELRSAMKQAAEAEGKTGTLSTEELLAGLGSEWSLVPTYQAAIVAVADEAVSADTLEGLSEIYEQPGQIYDVELLVQDQEWFLLDPAMSDRPDDVARLEKYFKEAGEVGALEVLRQAKRIDVDGLQLIEALADPLGDPRAVSMAFRAAGWKGNKFFEQATRVAHRQAVPPQREADDKYNYVLFDAADAVIKDRLFQEKMGFARGFISMDETKSWFKITLTEKADLSTFLHESGHFFLEAMQRMAASPDAPSDLTADLLALREWMGLEEGQPIPTGGHEKFARAFEQYLMNGESPNLTLVEAFAAFKSWLVMIYQRLSKLNVDMTPEVRGVMDRMFASQEAINEARTAMDFRPVFEDAETAGMTAEQFHTYHRMMAKAMRGAADDLELKALREFKRTFTREYKALRKGMEAEVTANIATFDKVQIAKHFLRTGKMLDGSPVEPALEGMKLSSGGLMAMYPHKKVLQRLMGLHRKDGWSPDLAASAMGFDSADQMVQEILKAPKLKELIKTRTDAGMLERHGDMLNDGTMEAEAIRSMHTDAVSNFLLTELKALGRKARVPDTSPADVIKKVAQDRVTHMKVQDLTPGRYRQAETREGRKAVELAAKGDFVGAHEAKRRQLLNHWISKFISQARETAAKQRDYLKTFDTKKVRQRMGRAGRETYLDAIDQYLDGVELRKKSMRSLGRRQSLNDWITAREEADEAIQIPERLRYESNLRNFKQLTVAEFTAIHDAVKNIEHLANLKNKLLMGKEQRDFKETKDALIAQIYTTQKKRPAEVEQNRRLFARLWHKILRFQAELTKPEFIARWIDGETAGRAHELIFQPFVDAQIAKLDMERVFAEKLDAVFKGMSPEQRVRMNDTFDVFGKRTTGQEVLAIALNMGNEGNFKKLVEGYPNRGWNAETLMARVQEILTLEDWRTVQGIWDVVEQLKEPIFALNEKMTGLPPPAVVPVSFTVEGETFRGGYYPVVYDPVKEVKAAEHAEKNLAKGIHQSNFMRPNVSKGFTEARTGYVGPILLSLDVLPAHLMEVIHFVTHYEAVTQVNKLINHAEVKDALVDTFGEEIQQQFLPWLQAIANAATTPPATGVGDQIIRHARHGTSVVAMGWKFSTAIMQAFGLFTTVDQIGFRATVSGMVEATGQLGLGRRAFEDINAKSGEVRHAMRTFDRDARQIIEQEFTKQGAAKQWTKIQGYTFALMGLMQKFVNMATWYGSYEQSIKAGKSEEQATNTADASVRQSQSGGGLKDLASIQRGGEGQQMLVMFYTYFSVLHNRLSETGRQLKGKQRIKDSPNVIARLTFLIMLPVFFESMARREWPEEEDEPVWWWAKRTMLYGVVTVPFVRDMASGIFSQYGYNMSPVASVLEKVARGGQGIGAIIDPEAEMTDAQLRGIFDTVGVTAKIPSGQLWILYNWLRSLEAGELENPVHELIYKPRD